MLRRIPPRDFELFRWPVDICVLGLALCYGLSRFVASLRNGPISGMSRLSLYAIATFLCTLVVRRYLPSDRDLKHRGLFAVSLWIHTSFMLAAGVPIIGILFVESPLFWAMMVLTSVLKALHALESARRKDAGEAEPRPELQLQPENTPGNGRRRPALDRLPFESAPDAYALRSIPTAMLLTLASSGIVGAFLFGPGRRAGQWLVGGALAGGLYAILSGVARRRAIRLSPRGVEPADEA